MPIPAYPYNTDMTLFERITFDPHQFGGKPCIRGLRVTVGTVLTLLRDHSHEEILADYPELEAEDIDAALVYAAYLAEERDILVA